MHAKALQTCLVMAEKKAQEAILKRAFMLIFQRDPFICHTESFSKIKHGVTMSACVPGMIDMLQEPPETAAATKYHVGFLAAA